MIHKGKILEEKIRKAGYSIKKLSDDLGVTRQTLYRWFTMPDLHNKHIKEVSDIIGYSFAKDIPSIAEEEGSTYGNEDDPRCIKILHERDKYLNLYINLQAKFNDLQEDLLNVTREARLLDKQLTIAKNKIPD